MALWKKTILVLLALPIVCFFGFIFLFFIGTSVGYLNFMYSYWGMKEIVVLAMDYPMPVDTDIGVEEVNGVLERPEYFADTYIRKDKDNRLHILFHKGGGHLGNQGYVYSEMLTESFRQLGNMPDSESYHYTHLMGNWWCYDGIYD